MALVLEDFGGRSLRHLLDERGPLEWPRSSTTPCASARRSGTSTAHGVIHKDIKPQNIIVNPATGVLKITDFSLSVASSLEAVAPSCPCT